MQKVFDDRKRLCDIKFHISRAILWRPLASTILLTRLFLSQMFSAIGHFGFNRRLLHAVVIVDFTEGQLF